MKEYKACIDCGELNNLDCFYFRKDIKKYNNQCKICIKAKRFRNNPCYQQYNKEKSKRNRQKHKELNNFIIIINETVIRTCRRCELSMPLSKFTARKSAKDGHINLCKECSAEIAYEERRNNSVKIKQYEKNRSKNINRKIRSNLANRIIYALSSQSVCKTKGTLELVGCSVEKLREHLEKQFKPGMTWNNHSFKGWHIDHIIPCSSFDLTDPEEQRKCFHYSNLQPLWARENLSKSNKIIIQR